jgi:hypothetical protein
MSVVESAAEDAVTAVAGTAASTSMLPWVLLGGVAIVAAAALGGYVYGHRAEEAQFNLYKSQQAALAEKQVAANKTALLVQQQADVAAMDKINQAHGEQLNAITQTRDTLLAANSDLARRLYVRTASPGQRTSGVSKAGASGPVDAQAGEIELPQQLGSWLVGRFTEADDDANLVTALQQVVIHDREVCNGSIPGVTQAPTAAQ